MTKLYTASEIYIDIESMENKLKGKEFILKSDIINLKEEIEKELEKEENDNSFEKGNPDEKAELILISNLKLLNQILGGTK